MGLFDKKYCSICGEKIGFLGNRKLEDGNLCKNCSAKLSPWFSDRRSSTVEEIREQLAYREENRNAVAALHVTRSYGEDTKVLIDEDAGKFIVTRARNYTDANPDVIDFSQVTGVDLDIDEERSEEYTTDKENKRVSYNPPRYTFSYDFYVVIRVNHRYFDEMRFKLNSSSVETTPSGGVPLVRKPNPSLNHDYKEYTAMGQEIKNTLTEARQRVRDDRAGSRAQSGSHLPLLRRDYHAGRKRLLRILRRRVKRLSRPRVKRKRNKSKKNGPHPKRRFSERRKLWQTLQAP